MLLHGIISTGTYGEPHIVPATRTSEIEKNSCLTWLIQSIVQGEVRHQTKHKDITSMLEGKGIGKVDQDMGIRSLRDGQIAL